VARERERESCQRSSSFYKIGKKLTKDKRGKRKKEKRKWVKMRFNITIEEKMKRQEFQSDKHQKGFSVKLQSGAELWSGCSGVDLERWAARLEIS